MTSFDKLPCQVDSNEPGATCEFVSTTKTCMDALLVKLRDRISPSMRIFLEPPAAMLTTILVALLLELALRDVHPVTCNTLETLKTMPGRRDRRKGAMLLRFRSAVCQYRLLEDIRPCLLTLAAKSSLHVRRS